MEEKLDRYDESLLMKVGICISLMFISIIIFLYVGVDVNFSKLFNKEQNKHNEVVGNINIENTIVSENIQVETEGRVVITLPGGVSEKNISVTKEIINKRIVIAFPKGAGDYDNSKIQNGAEVLKNMDINVSDVMVKLDMALGSVRDCKISYEHGKMMIDFFDISKVESPVIVIDSGHGGSDVGAIENGIYEKNIDLDICKKLKEMLDSKGILVYYTREDDSYPSVEDRVDFANEVMPDLFISIHSNWYDYSDVSGTSVLYNIKDNSEHGSAWLSEILCEEIVKSSGTTNRGIIDGNDIHIVRNSKSPVALIETGFMSNADDFKLLSSEDGQRKIAEGIYNGIIRSLTELGKY